MASTCCLGESIALQIERRVHYSRMLYNHLTEQAGSDDNAADLY
jgi:hypothetical protein